MRKYLYILAILLLPVSASAKQHHHIKSNFVESGLASYYNNSNTGHRTASGQLYNPNLYTCASRTLPLGALVRVTNLKNGDSVVVRVNDRGPYVRPRILDLSRSAAKKLGMLHVGVIRVRVAILPPLHKHFEHSDA